MPRPARKTKKIRMNLDMAPEVKDLLVDLRDTEAEPGPTPHLLPALDRLEPEDTTVKGHGLVNIGDPQVHMQQFRTVHRRDLTT